ncbi:T9SS type A sorting domain-containing protein, partial [Aureisphaera galaxeae]|uniref:T9SS type A sorting domain-containing protein n=1 Tax=Aureisphaera galaxeae TaxID=1538023 RepID=UPI0023503E22
VSMKYNALPTACESFTYGEVEDYIVVIPTPFQTPGGSSSGKVYSATELFLSPNPVINGYINILVTGSDATEYSIYNIIGQVVAKGTIEETIDVSHLQSGMYLLQINDEGENLIKRFIVE